MTATPEPCTDDRRRRTIKAVPLRHPRRWVAAAVLAGPGRPVHLRRGDQRRLPLGHATRKYLFDQRITQAALVTLELTVLAMVIGVVLGVVLAVMRLSPNPVLSLGRLGLPVDLPRHAGLRAAGVLGPVSVALPDARHRHPVRSGSSRIYRHEALITLVRRRRASGWRSTRRPTWPRSCGPASCPSTRGRPRRRPRWA